jgi:hypothetical protein
MTSRLETLADCYAATMHLRFLHERGDIDLDEFFCDLEPILDRARWLQGVRLEDDGCTS